MRVLITLLSAALMLSLSSLGAMAAPTSTPAPTATPALALPANKLDIKSSDRGFSIPSEVKAGRYLVTLDNTASSTLEATLVRLPKGVSAADYQASLLSLDLPSWASEAVAVGGPGETDPGDRTQAIVDLTAGDYAVTTNTSNPPLTAPFTVTEDKSAKPPTADSQHSDAKVVIHDDSVTMPKTIKPGPQIWQVINLGHSDHQFMLTAVPAKITVEDMKEAISRAPGAGVPKGGLDWADVSGAGGVAGLSPGQTTWAVLDLKPGRIAAYDLYYNPDSVDHVFALSGVLAVFTVAAPAAQATATAKAARATATAEAPKATATAAPAAKLQPGGTAVVTTDGLNVRSQPTTSGDIVGTLNSGDVVTITDKSVDADGYTWWPVTTPDGTSGWIAGDFLQPQQ